MVCEKCQARLAKRGHKSLAVTDVWKDAGRAPAASSSKAGSFSSSKSGSGSSWKEFSSSTMEARDERKIGENKLLSSKKKARFEPYMKKDMLSGSKGKEGAKIGKCEKCGSTIAEAEHRLCQACAYPRGLCSMCTQPVMDTRGYRMSSK